MRWPSLILNVNIMLLAKPQGGFRPIALLPALYRIYTKVRLQHVREWMATNSRPYFALGAQKCTLDVGARTMIYSEAFGSNQTKAATTTLVDIIKCIDRICWRKVLQAAAHFEFPTQLLQLCLAMYYAPRKIKWATSFS